MLQGHRVRNAAGPPAAYGCYENGTICVSQGPGSNSRRDPVMCLLGRMKINFTRISALALGRLGVHRGGD